MHHRLSPPLLLIMGFMLMIPTLQAQDTDQKATAKIEWLTFEEAVERNKKETKMIFIDVYTDWCGWCKRMDKTTFENPMVVKTMNTYFHAVKFDAEQQEDIVLGDTTYKYLANGRRGVHELAVALLQGQLSYPTVVFLDEEFTMIQPLPGYRTAAEMDPILAYIGSKAFASQEFKDFQEEYAAQKSE